MIPHDAGTHDGLSSNSNVVSSPSPHESDLTCIEYGFGSLQIEKEPQVRAAIPMFEHLADLAVDQQASVALIDRVMHPT